MKVILGVVYYAGGMGLLLWFLGFKFPQLANDFLIQLGF